jgi:hypothetical protein
VLVRNESVLNVRTSDLEDMGYNLKRDGWLNNFTNVKIQSMRDDRVPWRGARKIRPEFFSIIFFNLTDKDDIILDWQYGIGLFFTSLFFYVLIFFVFGPFCIHFFIPVYSHFFVLGGSIIACRSIQSHIVVLESDIDIYKSIFLLIREPEQEHTSQHAAPQRGLVFAPSRRKRAKRNFDLLCA